MLCRTYNIIKKLKGEKLLPSPKHQFDEDQSRRHAMQGAAEHQLQEELKGGGKFDYTGSQQLTKSVMGNLSLSPHRFLSPCNIV